LRADLGFRRTPFVASAGALGELEEALSQAQTLFEDSPEVARKHPKAADWLLDNLFVVQRSLRQVRDDMPKGFYRRLPVRRQEANGLPRADRIAIESRVKRFQREEPLTIAELWALPALLRLRTLEVLVEELSVLLPISPRPRVRLAEQDRLAHIDAEEQLASCVRALRTLDGIRWRVFFRHCSKVERILCRDPAQTYARMDFDTQDRYRKVVEEVAWRTPRTETEVAEKALELAHRFAAQGGRHAHVGHYLVGEGVGELERLLGYRPPAAVRLQRCLKRHPSFVLHGGIGLTTTAFLLLPAWYLTVQGASAMTLSVGTALALIPASTLGITVVHWLLTNFLPPHVLPKMDYSEAIPEDGRTIVIVPCMLGSEAEARDLVRQLELHYLRNPSPELRFALLSDYLDAPEQHVASDDSLLGAAENGVRHLNRKYAGRETGPFHLFHRERRWNASEGVWMGWERKRGKIEEFNALLLKDAGRTSFTHNVGDDAGREGIRFVITLDVGTILPRGAAARLIGILAHPLNRPEFDPEAGRVMRGYAVVQPRVEVSPTSSAQSRFTRIFAGDTAIDIYSRAVSDVYQDLWGQGIFIGKGIYDLEAFHRSLKDRVPENVLVSHDHVEGLYARVALATDVVIFEDYPPQYLAYARRLHRWIRGDWQFLPWLRGTVRDATGERVRNPIPWLGRWILFDNVRRSLVAPATLLFLMAAWLWLPGNALVWTLAAVLAPAAHVFTGIVSRLVHGPTRGSIRPWAAGFSKHLRETSNRWLLYLAFLAHEALVSSDAVLRACVRMVFTRRLLLQWRTAEHTAQLLASRGPHTLVWTEMAGSPFIALGLGAAIVVIRPEALPWAAPLLGLWLAAPEIARRISRPVEREGTTLTATEVAKLRRLGRRTWLFFEAFVGPEDQWLPPDNYQERPLGEIAHRTSPTNVGMLLSSTLAAYDLGYLGPTDFAFRVRNTLDTLDRMQCFRGHLFNWYDTRTLEPLEPRYVSTVDSGNLAAALVALKQGCIEIATTGVLFKDARRVGLHDTLNLLEDAVGAMERSDPSVPIRAFREQLGRLRLRLDEVRKRPELRYDALEELCGPACSELDQTLVELVADFAHGMDPEAIRDVRLWLDRTHQHLRGMKRELGLFAPWQAVLLEREGFVLLEAAGQQVLSTGRELRDILRLPATLTAVPATCALGRSKLEELLAQLEQAAPEAGDMRKVREWLARIERSLDLAQESSARLENQLLELASRAEKWVQGMDFRLLYDGSRGLFRIGFDAGAGRSDPNYYDLLASEARIASFLAVAKGDAPVKHWFLLQRPVVRNEGRTTLLSWGATMFEYAMPCLWMRSGDRSLLRESVRGAVDAQISYGKRRGVPWGISESGFYQLDARSNYQYRSFGVPGLGLRRGLSEDLVIAPYASALALMVRPREVVENFDRLERIGMLGTYGFYEAVDFTPDRMPIGQEHAIVASYMAHHQGMILVAIDNVLEQDALVRRFRRDALVQTTELLLHEEVPLGASRRPGSDVPSQLPAPGREQTVLHPWRPAASDGTEEGLVLSNGRMSSFVTEGGSGWLTWNGCALTRWRPDSTLGRWGSWIYLRDEASGRSWSAGRSPTHAQADEEHVIFHPHLAEFQRRDDGIFLRMEVSVAPRDDVEIRHITLTNETAHARRVSVTSYAEPVLTPTRADSRHPAFSKLFVESEYLDEEQALLFQRRRRSDDEQPVFLRHHLIAEDRLDGFEYETDRGAFLGRCRTQARPSALDPGQRLGGTTGDTLDPLMAIRGTLQLEPYETIRVAFVTAVAGSRRAVLDLARRFRTLDAIDWALREAQTVAMRDAHASGLEARLLPPIQRLISFLQQPRPGLRGNPRAIGMNRLGKPALWAHGISGDLPILLVRLSDPRDAEILSDVLQAHRFWRERDLHMDLVVLLLGSSSYGGEDDDEVRRRIRRHRSAEWLNRRGGIFVLHADQIPPDERNLLEAVASVVLFGAHGGLANQLEGQEHAPDFPAPLLASVPASNKVEPTPALKPIESLLFWNGHGGFSTDGKEYVIQLEPGATTPAPWCNVLANPSFGCLATESGIGAAWSLNSALHRLTSWSNDPVSDPPSQVLYLRDEETGTFWSTTPLPAGGPSACRVRHGAGTTEYHRNSHGVEQRMRVFVPRTDPLEIVQLRLRNLWSKPRRLTATFYAELVQGESREESLLTAVHEYDEETGTLLTRNPWDPTFAERRVFMAASEPTHGVTCDRTELLGHEHGPARPAALERWGLSGSVLAGVDPCQALMVHIELAPGEEREVWFLFGEGADRESSLELVQRYRKAEMVEAARAELAAFWDKLLGAVQVKTPEPAMDLLLNRWLLYQSLASRIEGRSGFYQSGGGFGFRDQLQDVMALVHSAPERVRAHILEAASHQFREGDVLHWWHPPTNQGVRTRCSDDLLWLPFVTAHYVRATGDRGILHEQVPFLEAEPLREDEQERYERYGHGDEQESLLEHCRRAVEHGLRYGPSGLPAIGTGDWNDGMNRVGVHGRGESMWLAWFAICALDGFAEMLEAEARGAEAAGWRRVASDLLRLAEEAGWDGAWYLRAWYDDGSPLGSHESKECRIDLIAQAWAALAGASKERVQEALASVEEQLVRSDERLIRLLTPPFRGVEGDPGYIAAYPPGIRENGGQYTHAAAWLGWAYASLGNGDAAERVFRLLNPILRTRSAEDVDRYRVEPYVLAADVYGVEPHVGRGGWTWYTGAAAWTWRLGVEGILGLKRVAGDLVVEPHLPSHWPGFEAVVRTESCTCRVVVDRSAQGDTATVSLDGDPLPSGRIPLSSLRGRHEVRVALPLGERSGSLTPVRTSPPPGTGS